MLVGREGESTLGLEGRFGTLLMGPNGGRKEIRYVVAPEGVLWLRKQDEGLTVYLVGAPSLSSS